MAAAFQVILEADEDDNRPSLKQHRVFRDRYICFTIMLLLTCIYIVYQFRSWKHTSAPPPISGSTCRHIFHSPLYGIVVGIAEKTFQYRSTRTDAHKSSMAMVSVFMIHVTPTAMAIQRQVSSERLKKPLS